MNRPASSIAGRIGRFAAAAALAFAGRAEAQALTADRALLLYNSAHPESAAVSEMYEAAHPEALTFDLADPDLPAGTISRDTYLDRVREPLRRFLSREVAGEPLAERVIAIATTRGLPARIEGEDEFRFSSSWASLESELALLHQDLEADGVGALTTRRHGAVDNPYHQRAGERAASFDRSRIAQRRDFLAVQGAAWRVADLSPGEIYLVCRLDAAASDGRTALENIDRLIDRSGSLRFNPASAQAVFDEYAARFDQLDDDSFTPLFPGEDDFAAAAVVFRGAGVETVHDQSFRVVDAASLPSPGKPILALGVYGENHDLHGWGGDPPGTGEYLQLFPHIHDAGVFVSYESFNGASVVDGQGAGGQGQALEFIARGGAFTIAHTAEPFTFSVADLAPLARNLYVEGLTFAEAAYAALPALSWQTTPIGDPLARVAVGPSPRRADLNDDGAVDGRDLAALLNRWGPAENNTRADLNDDGEVDAADLGALLAEWSG